MQSKNDGIIMVNFLPWFVNCSNPRDASLKDVAGKGNYSQLSINIHVAYWILL